MPGKNARAASALTTALLLLLSAQPLAARAQKPAPARRVAAASEARGVGRGRVLWPGSRFTQAQRASAVERGLRFIYRTALEARNFDEYGSDYLWCFHTLSAGVRDARVRRTARRMGVERARQWRRDRRTLPPDADADTVIDFAFGDDAAASLGLHAPRLKSQIRRAAARFTARDFLHFDPASEPPPGDVPEACRFDGQSSPRGSPLCRACARPLKMRSRYDVWYDALIATYVGERSGVPLGAGYADVLKWLPTLRPYRGPEGGANPDFYDTAYAITHVVYTLNDYNLYRLSPAWLPREYEFLKSHLRESIARRDADMLGEFMDSLRAFGVTEDDPGLRAGVEYLLAHQNPDGSWGDPAETDIYLRYHPTWNAVAALSDYAWRGYSPKFAELKTLVAGGGKDEED